jgi:hypothetical protein
VLAELDGRRVEQESLRALGVPGHVASLAIFQLCSCGFARRVVQLQPFSWNYRREPPMSSIDPITAAPPTAGMGAASNATTPVMPVTPVMPSTPAPAGPPSVHVRAVITWLAIFPLVAVGMMLIGPVSESWHPVLRAFVLTVVVVPLAVYLVVPRLLGAYGALRRRAARRAQGAH